MECAQLETYKTSIFFNHQGSCYTIIVAPYSVIPEQYRYFSPFQKDMLHNDSSPKQHFSVNLVREISIVTVTILLVANNQYPVDAYSREYNGASIYTS